MRICPCCKRKPILKRKNAMTCGGKKCQIENVKKWKLKNRKHISRYNKEYHNEMF